jgi:PPOX class probable F420-dependent enzyme
MLTDAMRDFLNEPHFAVVATIGADGMPHQTVIWYELRGDEIVMSTPQESLKHRHLQRDPRMSLCVEDGFRYVTVHGRATLVEEPEAARALYATVGSRYRNAVPMPSAPPRDPKVMELLSRERVTIRLSVDHVHSNGF